MTPRLAYALQWSALALLVGLSISKFTPSTWAQVVMIICGVVIVGLGTWRRYHEDQSSDEGRDP